MTPPAVTVHATLTPTLAARLDTLASQHGTTASLELARAVEHHLACTAHERDLSCRACEVAGDFEQHVGFIDTPPYTTNPKGLL